MSESSWKGELLSSGKGQKHQLSEAEEKAKKQQLQRLREEGKEKPFKDFILD